MVVTGITFRLLRVLSVQKHNLRQDQALATNTTVVVRNQLYIIVTIVGLVCEVSIKNIDLLYQLLLKSFWAIQR